MRATRVSGCQNDGLVVCLFLRLFTSRARNEQREHEMLLAHPMRWTSAAGGILREIVPVITFPIFSFAENKRHQDSHPVHRRPRTDHHSLLLTLKNGQAASCLGNMLPERTEWLISALVNATVSVTVGMFQYAGIRESRTHPFRSLGMNELGLPLLSLCRKASARLHSFENGSSSNPQVTDYRA